MLQELRQLRLEVGEKGRREFGEVEVLEVVHQQLRGEQRHDFELQGIEDKTVAARRACRNAYIWPPTVRYSFV